jgi:hypothetical protein
LWFCTNLSTSMLPWTLPCCRKACWSHIARTQGDQISLRCHKLFLGVLCLCLHHRLGRLFQQPQGQRTHSDRRLKGTCPWMTSSPCYGRIAKHAASISPTATDGAVMMV